MRPRGRLLVAAVPAVLMLAACASPCQRVDDRMRVLNAEAIRDPGILNDGTYLRRFRELTAEAVEHRCL